ncbi:MAG: hypothetical protein ORN98_04875 [Alphaproteobacteria bacterium]|nr:hypothetical protein [Alphaproteobacteria bacterium]
MSIIRPSTLNRINRYALSGIDVAIIASPHIALPLLELPNRSDSGEALSPKTNSSKAHPTHIAMTNDNAGQENPVATSRRGHAHSSSHQNLLDLMLNHLAAAGAKRATICIGPDARGIWTDREYRKHANVKTDSRYRSDAASTGPEALSHKSHNNYTAELSWALSDLSPQTERKWPINLDWAVDWRGFGNLALLSMALPMMRSNPILVVCGDRFQPIDFTGFLAQHRRGGEQVTMLCRKANPDDLAANEKLHLANRGDGGNASTNVAATDFAPSDFASEFLCHGGKISLDEQGRVTRLGLPQGQSSEYKYLQSGMYLFDYDYLAALCKLLQHNRNEAKLWSIEREIMAMRDAGSYAAYVDSTPIYWPNVQIHPPKSRRRDHKPDKIIAFPTDSALKPRLTAARNM